MLWLVLRCAKEEDACTAVIRTLVKKTKYVYYDSNRQSIVDKLFVCTNINIISVAVQ